MILRRAQGHSAGARARQKFGKANLAWSARTHMGARGEEVSHEITELSSSSASWIGQLQRFWWSIHRSLVQYSMRV